MKRKSILRAVAAVLATFVPGAAWADPISMMYIATLGFNVSLATMSMIWTVASIASSVYGSVSARRKARKAQNAARDAYNAQLTERIANVISEIPPRQIIYGRATAGASIHAMFTSDKPGYRTDGTAYTRKDAIHHLVYVFAAHEISAVHDIKVGGKSCFPLDANGYSLNSAFQLHAGLRRQEIINVPAGQTVGTASGGVIVEAAAVSFGGGSESNPPSIITPPTGSTTVTNDTAYDVSYALTVEDPARSALRITVHMGNPDQAADARLMSLFPDKWTSNHRLRGRFYMVVEVDLEFSEFQSGPPVIFADVDGKIVEDLRNATTAFSANNALCIRDFLMSQYGAGADAAEINAAYAIAAANACDASAPISVAGYTDQSQIAGNAGWTGGTVNGSVLTVTGAAPVSKSGLTIAGGTSKYLRARVRRLSGTGWDGTLRYSTGSHGFLDNFRLQIAAGFTIGVWTELVYDMTALTAGGANWITNTITGLEMKLGVTDADQFELEWVAASSYSETSTTGPRYQISAVFTTDDDREQVLHSMAAAMGGFVYNGGEWLLVPGAWTAPVLSYDDNDLWGQISIVRSDTGYDELANSALATYYPVGSATPTEMDPYVNSALVTEDGEELWLDVPLAYVSSEQRARNLARQAVEKTRNGQIIRIPLKLDALAARVGDRISVTSAEYGFAAKTYQVTDWQFDAHGPIVLTGREDTADTYDYADLSVGDPTPNTNRPAIGVMPAVQSLAASSGTAHLLVTGDGTVVTRTRITWATPLDTSVLSGGNIHLLWRRSFKDAADTWYTDVYPADASSAYIVGPVENDVLSVRAQYVAGLRQGPIVTITHVVVGKTQPPTNVTGLVSAVVPGSVRVSWAACADADYLDTELRVGASWGAGVTLVSPGPTRVTGTSFLWPRPGDGSYTIWAAHRDTSLNYSIAPVSTFVTVTSAAIEPAPPGTLNTEITLTPGGALQGAGGGTIDLGLLTGALAASQLATALNTRINLIDDAANVAGSVNARIATLDSEVTADIGAINSDIGDINAEISTLTTNVSTVQSQVNDLINTPAYDNADTYTLGQIVKYNGSIYRALQTTTGNLPTDVTYWEKIGDYETLAEVVAAHTSEISTLTTDLSAEISSRTALATQVNDPTTGLPATRSALLTNYYVKSATDSAIASAVTGLVSTTTLNNSLANYTNTASLTANYYTKTATDSAISAATTGLVSTTTFNNTLANYTNTATLQANYYTKTATDSAISAATLNLVSNSSLSTTLGSYATTAYLSTNHYTKTATDSAISAATTGLVSTTTFNNTLANYTNTATLQANHYTKTATDSAISAATTGLVSTTTFNNTLANYTNTATLQANHYTKTATDSAISAATTGLVSTTTMNTALSSYATTAYVTTNYYTKTTVDSSFASMTDRVTSGAAAPFTALLGWSLRNALGGWLAYSSPTYGSLTATSYVAQARSSTGGDLIIYRTFSADERFLGSKADKIRVRLRKSGSPVWAGHAFYETLSGHTFGGSHTKTAPEPVWSSDGYGVAEWDMSALTAGGTDWVVSTITSIRLDLERTANGGTYPGGYDIESISVGSRAGTDLSTTVQQQATSLNGVQALYTVKIDNNGYLSGFGLMSSLSSGGSPTSQFYIQANDFAVINPAKTPGAADSVPFAIIGSPKTINGVSFAAGAYLHGSMMINGTVSITDGSGNVILSSGQNLASARVNADAGWLNSNVTVDSSGNITGIGSGSGQSVANNTDGRIRHPGGGLYTTSSSVLTGAIKVRLPVYFTDTMIKFFVDIYEYGVGYSCTLEIAGYNASGTTSWLNVTARVSGGSTVEYPVRFGHDGTRSCVWIGDNTETWSYPQIQIRDVLVGYNSFARSTWESGWSISFHTSAFSAGNGTGQYSASVTDTLPGADWSKTARRPANVAALVGTEGINNAAVSITAAGALQGAGGGQVTPVGLGAVATSLSNAPSAILNSTVSITAAGALQGAGGGQVTPVGLGAVATNLSNAPGGILNSSVSITAAGALQGAGGGQVSITGLGFAGSLNATSDLTLFSSGNVTIAGNKATKINTNSWDGGAYSGNGYSAAYAIGQFGNWGAMMFGLNTDPSSSANYQSIDFAVYSPGDGAIHIYESGTLVASPLSAGSIALTDVFSVVYDGRSIYYFRNGAVLYMHGVTVAAPLYFDCSLATDTGYLHNLRFGPVTKTETTNLLDTRTWVVGSSGGQVGFPVNGTSAGGSNSIVTVQTPTGDYGSVWRGSSGSAGGSSPEGGWTTADQPVDRTKMYRFSVFVYCSGPGGVLTGSYYLGCAPDTVLTLAGAVDSNPYFVSGSRSGLVNGRWYLLVGYVYPQVYGGSVHLGGVYDCTSGVLVAAGTSFKWRSTSVTSVHRAYQFYTTAAGNIQDFWAPRMDVCDGSEPSLAALLAMGAVSGRNQINSANVSTYIASAAIGWAQIGDLVISTSGGVRSGKTTYGAGTGWLLEYNGGVPRFDIGNTTNYLRWDGSQLIYSGDITKPKVIGSKLLATDAVASRAGSSSQTPVTTNSSGNTSWTILDVATCQVAIPTEGGSVSADVLIIFYVIVVADTISQWVKFTLERSVDGGGYTVLWDSETVDGQYFGIGTRPPSYTKMMHWDTGRTGTVTYKLKVHHRDGGAVGTLVRKAHDMVVIALKNTA